VIKDGLVKKKQVEKFVKEYLLPSLPGFQARGNLLYQVPVYNILPAFLFDSSGFSATVVHPQAFVQLLYIPSDHLTLTPGKRFLGNWEFVPGNEVQLSQRLLHEIHSVGIPFIRVHGTPEDIVRETKANPALRMNPHVRQQLAYSLLLLCRNHEGLDELDKLLDVLNRISEAQPWARTIHAEVGQLREALGRNSREVLETLNLWTEQTRKKLGLPE
jgi:hypothetical protein